jgi:methylation protein EvaC
MNKCLICGGQMEKLFSMGKQPLANKYPASTQEFKAEIVEEMHVFYCDPCSYLNIPCNTNRSVFFEDYYYLSSVNKELVDHFSQLAESIKTGGYRFVVDVGSNDGILLKPLKDRKIQCLGLDPSENVSEIANAAGLETLVGFFNPSSADRIKANYGHPDLICASSVFTHLEHPADFFRTANSLLADDGEILIEVEYLKEIVDRLCFERFYFDRPHYYSVRSLKILGEISGFKLVRVEPITAHGGSVRAIFARKEASTPIDSSVSQSMEEESLLLRSSAIQRQFELFKSECVTLKKKLEAFRQSGKIVTGYGCPARFSTITNFADIGADLIPCVIDDSPLKSGRFSPGKHIPITDFSNCPNKEIFIVFAYEYIDSIKRKVRLDQVKYFKPIPFEAL